MRRCLEHIILIQLPLWAIPDYGVFAQSWQPLGLHSEEVTAIAVDERDSSILFVGSGSDFSAGTTGSVFKTTDRGAHWDTLLRGLHVNGIILHPWSSDTVFILSGIANFSVPGILRSSNGGHAWVWSDSGMLLSSELSPLCLAINPANSSVMYAGTGGFGGGSFYKSTDAGRSWFRTPDSMSGSMVAVTLDPVHPETLYVGTSSQDAVWESLDGGMHWSVTLHNLGGASVVAIAPPSHDNMYVLDSYDDGGPFARSSDRGKTWVHRRISGTSQQWASSLVLDRRRAQHLYATVSGSTLGVFKTTDAGDSWTAANEGIEGHFAQVLCIDSSNDQIYLGTFPNAGNPGGVYARSLVTHVKERSIDEEFRVSECFPNPFNGTTAIRYFLPRREHVNMRMWDILGRAVMKILDETQERGAHSAHIDGSLLSSGVYFLQFEAGRSVKVKKTLLLR